MAIPPKGSSKTVSRSVILWPNMNDTTPDRMKRSIARTVTFLYTWAGSHPAYRSSRLEQ